MSNHLSIMDIFLPCLCPINKLFVFITLSTQCLGGYEIRFLLLNQKHVCLDPIEKGTTLDFVHICDFSKFCFIDNIWYCYVCIVHYTGILFISTKSTFIGDQLLADRGRNGSWHHSCMWHLNHFSIFNVFFLWFSSLVLQLYVNNGWIKIGNQCKKLWRVHCNSLYFLCNVWEK
jgi:hypothetical protein